MLFDFPERSDEEEMMDDFSLGGSDFEDSLDQIANINKWLGGNSITINAIKSIFQATDNKTTLTIVDAGCGNGDMCRRVAKLARAQNQSVEILGIDANATTIAYAEAISKEFPEITYQVVDIFSQEFAEMHYDIMITTLTIHHFPDEQLEPWLALVAKNMRKSLIVNDLHRSRLAYGLFQVVCFVFRLNTMNREDGLVSIKRAFVRSDLKKYDTIIKKSTPNLSSTVSWKWAFRYLWIIHKI